MNVVLSSIELGQRLCHHHGHLLYCQYLLPKREECKGTVSVIKPWIPIDGSVVLLSKITPKYRF